MKAARHLQHKTFGFAEIPLPTPDKFLKKDEGVRRHYERPKTSHQRCTLRRPPIPNLDDLKKAQSMQNLEGEKNFKLINIKRAKSAFLRNKPGPKKFEQTPPVYINKPKYGKVPRYLLNITEQLQKMEIESRKREEEIEGNQKKDIRFISHEDKNKLLEGLQHNWELMQKEYQKMPLLSK
jgi:Calmodulin-binding